VSITKEEDEKGDKKQQGDVKGVGGYQASSGKRKNYETGMRKIMRKSRRYSVNSPGHDNKQEKKKEQVGVE